MVSVAQGIARIVQSFLDRARRLDQGRPGVEPLVDLAPLAENSILARYFVSRIRAGLVDAKLGPKRRRFFGAMRTTIFIVDFDSGDGVTLRFDHGRLTVHEGTIGQPQVTFGAPRRALFSLQNFRLQAIAKKAGGAEGLIERDERASTPPPSTRTTQTGALSFRELAALYVKGDLKIYGWARHPRTVDRFLRLVS